MTHACCPTCRLRFAATTPGAARCPVCHSALDSAPASELVGFRLGDDAAHTTLAQAVAAAAALPHPAGDA